MKRILLIVTVLLLSFIIIIIADRERKATVVKPASYSQQLFESRNSYIGDNSADGKILGLLNISEKLGNFTMELQTAQEPYGIKLNFQDKVKERAPFDLQMRKYALIILALIENAGEAQWSYTLDKGNREVRIQAKVSIEDARNIVGKDIKEYGKTQSQVQELLNKLEL